MRTRNNRTLNTSPKTVPPRITSNVMEVVRTGRMCIPPEPDIRFTGLKCRMEHFVSGMNVTVVVAVKYPESDLTVVTVIDIN